MTFFSFSPLSTCQPVFSSSLPSFHLSSPAPCPSGFSLSLSYLLVLTAMPLSQHPGPSPGAALSPHDSSALSCSSRAQLSSAHFLHPFPQSHSFLLWIRFVLRQQLSAGPYNQLGGVLHVICYYNSRTLSFWK